MIKIIYRKPTNINKVLYLNTLSHVPIDLCIVVRGNAKLLDVGRIIARQI